MDTNKNQDISREIRKEFFAFRNGVVADKLRKAGDPHPIIMGCLLVDLAGIAQRVRETVGDKEQLVALASELWNDTNSRECRLAAPMLYPADMMTPETALQWCQTVESTEVADNLCHKLLRNIDGSDELMRRLVSDARPFVKYTGYRLLLNLLLLDKVQPTAQLQLIISNEAQHAHGALAALLQDLLEEF